MEKCVHHFSASYRSYFAELGGVDLNPEGFDAWLALRRRAFAALNGDGSRSEEAFAIYMYECCVGQLPRA